MAQEFSNVTSQHEIIHSFMGEYGCGASFVDFNDDGWDDLSICNHNQNLLFYKNVEGTLSLIEPFVSNDESAKQVTWVDFDNDGDKDLFITKENSPFRLYENLGELEFQDITESSGLPLTYDKTYGNCWGDYNNDGWLDFFICNYENVDISNLLFKNNGDGTFTDMTEELGFSMVKDFSFQAVFLDYDKDGWQDLFVINDRIFFHNRLYHNENGTFTEVTSSAGMNYYISAMSNTVGDFNNDSWLDVYISNDNDNLLMKNNGDGTFDEVGDFSNTSVLGFSWGASWIDYDNNSLQDLVVCTSPMYPGSGKDHLMTNNSDGTFSPLMTSGFFSQSGFSYAPVLGDIDNNGFNDLLIVRGLTSSTRLWKNNANSNHNFLKVKLQGSISNRDGIGSFIEIFHNGSYQMKYTLCGEGYLSQNSQNLIFGLGSDTVIDSLKVTWLSGVVDVFYDLPVNQTRLILEGESLSNSISASGPLSFCEGDSVMLDAGDYEIYQWSNGHDGRYLNIFSTGEYFVTVTDSFGFQFTSDTLQVQSFENPVINANIQHITCFGAANGQIALQNFTGSDIDYCHWSDNNLGTERDSLPPGIYHYDLTDENGCLANGTISIFEPTELEVEIETIDQISGEHGEAFAELSGGTPPYIISWSNGEENSLHIDSLDFGSYNLLVTDANGCMVSKKFEIDFIQSASSLNSRSIRLYPNPFFNELIIEGLEGTSYIEIFDQMGSSVYSDEIMNSPNPLLLNSLSIPPGVYYLKLTVQNKSFRYKLLHF